MLSEHLILSRPQSEHPPPACLILFAAQIVHQGTIYCGEIIAIELKLIKRRNWNYFLLREIEPCSKKINKIKTDDESLYFHGDLQMTEADLISLNSYKITYSHLACDTS